MDNKEQERVNYINEICDNINKRMKEDAEKEAKSEKEKFEIAIDKYKNDLVESVKALKLNVEAQELTIDIVNNYIKNYKIPEELVDSINSDVATKQEIIDNAKKVIKMSEHKLKHFDEVKAFMLGNYEMMVNINFMFDNCLKLNGEYNKKIAEF